MIGSAFYFLEGILMKKIIAAILALCLVGGSYPLNYQLVPEKAYAENSSDEYVLSGDCGDKGSNATFTLDKEGTLTITGKGEINDTINLLWSNYSKDIKKIVIGEGITRIRCSNFDGLQYVTSITIPESVVEIESSSFMNFINLTTVNLPISLKEIKNGTFSGCDDLTSIEIPDGVTVIEDRAFEGCTKLNSIKIPDSVTEIGGSAFENTPWLNAQIMKDPIVIVNNILIEGKNCTGDVVIPNSVKKIGIAAFHHSKMTSVEIPDSVEVISEGAFSDCTKLTSLTIPGSVKKIDPIAFYGCSVLESVTIEEGVESIGIQAFTSCTNLAEIIIPATVKEIGSQAFANTKWLQLKREENPLVIVNGTLIDGKKCTGDIVIPDGVTSISDSAFESSSITSVKFPSTLENIDDFAFAFCSKLTSVTIPEGVSDISYGAFSYCDSLASAVIPASVNRIEEMSFSDCPVLESVTIKNPACVIDDNDLTFNHGLDEEGNITSFGGTIYGYEGSTAQKYAETYNIKFKNISDAPAPVEAVFGDANGDGKVLLNDSILILQYLGNPDAYPLSDEALECSDVSNHGDGITNSDALAVQKYVLGLIPDLPNYS